MNGLQPGLQEQLDRLVPVTAVEADWETIIRGARTRRGAGVSSSWGRSLPRSRSACRRLALR